MLYMQYVKTKRERKDGNTSEAYNETKKYHSHSLTLVPKAMRFGWAATSLQATVAPLSVSSFRKDILYTRNGIIFVLLQRLDGRSLPSLVSLLKNFDQNKLWLRCPCPATTRQPCNGCSLLSLPVCCSVLLLWDRIPDEWRGCFEGREQNLIIVYYFVIVRQYNNSTNTRVINTKRRGWAISQ